MRKLFSGLRGESLETVSCTVRDPVLGYFTARNRVCTERETLLGLSAQRHHITFSTLLRHFWSPWSFSHSYQATWVATLGRGFELPFLCLHRTNCRRSSCTRQQQERLYTNICGHWLLKSTETGATKVPMFMLGSCYVEPCSWQLGLLLCGVSKIKKLFREE